MANDGGDNGVQGKRECMGEDKVLPAEDEWSANLRSAAESPSHPSQCYIRKDGSRGDPVIKDISGDVEILFSKIEIDSGLNAGEMDRVKELLRTEIGAFALRDDDLGNFRDLEMKINLTDDIPVRTVYNSIPRHMYDEVKVHLTE